MFRLCSMADPCKPSCHSPPPTASAPSAPTVVPLSEQRNRFMVDVAVNGVGGFRFLLDTGATTHFISPRLVEQLRLPQVDWRVAKGYDGRFRERVVRVDGMTVGGVPLRRTDVIVWPHEGTEQRDGLIGYPFLFPSAVLSLAAGEISLGGRAGDAMVPVRAEVTRHQTLLIGAVGGVEGHFLFDTGAQSFTITPAYLRRVAASAAFRDTPKLGRRTGENEAAIVAFRPDEIAFGDFRIASPTIRVAPDEGGGNVFDGVDGLFGVNMIKPYAWALDQAARSLRAGPAQA